MIYIKEGRRWWRKYIKDLWDRQIENDNKCIEIRIFDYYDSVIVLFFSHNSLIKSIVSRIYLLRKTDFEKSMKRSRNFQNFNCLCKSQIPRSLSYFIFFRLKFHRLSRELLYSCFARRCLTNFQFQLINSSDEC